MPALEARLRHWGYGRDALANIMAYIRDEAPIIIHIDLASRLAWTACARAVLLRCVRKQKAPGSDVGFPAWFGQLCKLAAMPATCIALGNEN